MKIETVLSLDKDGDGNSIEEILVQIQKSTNKVIILINDNEIIYKDLTELKPLKKWKLEDIDETDYGHIYSLQIPNKNDSSIEFESEDSDDGDSDLDDNWVVFRKDAFEILTKPKEKKKVKSKGKSKGKKKEK